MVPKSPTAQPSRHQAVFFDARRHVWRQCQSMATLAAMATISAPLIDPCRQPSVSSNWRVNRPTVNISAASKTADLPVKTVRYYADIGLVSAPFRSEAGYRTYDDGSVRKLVFVRRAREFGFSVDECRELLSLYEDQHRSSADVKRNCNEAAGGKREKAAGAAVTARRARPPRRCLQGRSQTGLPDHRWPEQPPRSLGRGLGEGHL